MEGLVILVVLAAVVILALVKSVVMVDQGYQVVIERLGKYNTTLEPGLSFIFPFLDRKAYILSTKDIVLEVPKQDVITKDNASIGANAIGYISIVQPRKAVYGVDNYQFAIVNLIQTTLRSIIGEMTLDETLSNRETIKTRLVADLDSDILNWGIKLKSVEIQDISPSDTMQNAMEAQAAAERSRRATVTEAEGLKQAQILEADGRLEASRRDAEAAIVLAESQRKAIELVQSSIDNKELSAMYLLGEKYIESMSQLSQSNNTKTVVYPADLQNVAKTMLSLNK